MHQVLESLPLQGHPSDWQIPILDASGFISQLHLGEDLELRFDRQHNVGKAAR